MSIGSESSNGHEPNTKSNDSKDAVEKCTAEAVMSGLVAIVGIIAVAAVLCTMFLVMGSR